MTTFPLRIGTPDGLLFSGDAVRMVLRTITGDRAILANHIDFCTGIGMGEAHFVLEDGTVRKAACIGGMVTMQNGVCRILSTTWEWADDIDKDRAQRAKERAEEKLRKGDLSEKEAMIQEAKLKRALVRLSVKNG
ncbi:MAG: F0F1 ATP synthase subunit epsilon [Lachnospiraceae bacterium]|nr:F0F1 ATP synthase subunit epsilon [Lachnospiraceae bacterium]